MDQIEIQIQDSTGNWRTYAMPQNISAMIMARMKELRWQFPDYRIRAIDQNGRVVDMM